MPVSNSLAWMMVTLAGLSTLASPRGARAVGGGWTVVEQASVFAVVTHKGGFAAGKAHDHLIAARGFEADLRMPEHDPAAVRFTFEAPVEGLAVDPPALQAAWHPRLAELGILDEPFGELEDKQRQKIRGTMLSRKQLDGASFPTVAARVTAVTKASTTVGAVEFSHRVTLAFTAHGREIEGPVAARFEIREERLVIEAVGTFAFTDFGIEPFSALLGAVKNLDTFHLFVHLEAVSASD